MLIESKAKIVRVPRPDGIGKNSIAKQYNDGSVLVSEDDLEIVRMIFGEDSEEYVIDHSKNDRLHTSGPAYSQKRSLHEKGSSEGFIMRGTNNNL